MNPFTGRSQSDGTDDRGVPGSVPGREAAKLAAAKDAAKKKLLRMVVQQAVDELGSSDNLVDEAFANGLIDESLVTGVRSILARRLVERFSSGADDAVVDGIAGQVSTTPEFDRTIDAVERRLGGTIADRVLSRMEDDHSVVSRTFEEIARVNDKAIAALADDVRDALMQSVADRAWARVVDPEELARVAETRLSDPGSGTEDLVERLAVQARQAALERALESVTGEDRFKALVDEIAGDMRSELAGQVSERLREFAESDLKNSVGTEVVESDRFRMVVEETVASVREKVKSRIARGTDPKRLAKEALDEASVVKEAAGLAVKEIVERVTGQVRERVGEEISSAAWREAIASEATEQAQAELVERVAREVIDRGVDSVPQAALDQVDRELGLIDSAVARVVDTAKSEVGERVMRALKDELPDADNWLRENDEAVRPLVESLVGSLSEKIGREVSEAVVAPETLKTAVEARLADGKDALARAAERMRGQLAERLSKELVETVTADSSVRGHVEGAVAELRVRIARSIAERITASTIEDLAAAASAYVNPDDPAVEEATRAVTDDLGRLVAVRAIDRLESDASRNRISESAASACEPQIQDSVARIEEQLTQGILVRITDRFSDAGEIARRAQDRIGADHAPLVAAGEVLKELVLEGLAKKASTMLLDGTTAADRAFSRIDFEDPRFAGALSALRNLLEAAVSEHALRGFEDVQAAATTVRGRIPDHHEAIIGTAALVRDLLLDDIARRTEASLSDARQVARLSLARVPEDSRYLAAATDALRDLLIGNLVRLTCDSFQDADGVARSAMERVDMSEEILGRARDVFKERVLMSVLGEAIREIGGSLGATRPEAHGAIFHQAMMAVARSQDVPSRPEQARIEAVPSPAKDRPPRAEARAAAERNRPQPKREADKTIDPIPSGDAWTRLSDIDHEVPEPAETRPALEDVIVTEFVDAEPETDPSVDGTENDAFEFSWMTDGDLPGDAVPEAATELSAPARAAAPDGGDGLPSEDDVTWTADDGLGCYVYGFVPRSGAPDLDREPIDGIDSRHELRYVSVRDVRAIVSTVSLDEFGTEALAARSRDAEWVRRQIRAHARVLDAFKSKSTVVPLRFGTVLPSEAAAARMVEDRYEPLSSALKRLHGKAEWGIRAQRNQDRMREHIAKSGRSVEESLDTLSAGVAQFVRDELDRSDDLAEAALVETVTAHCIRRADDALRRWADDAADKAIGPSDGDPVMNRAYLVGQANGSPFRAEVRKLNSEFAALGLTFEVTGPWPPFHFAHIDDDASTGLVPVHG